MKIKWMSLSLVIGLLIFVVGCVVDILVFELFGAFVLFPFIAGITEKILPEKKREQESV